MKTRHGFVSNSSSSSFIIYRKGDYSRDEIMANNKKVFEGYDDDELLESHSDIFIITEVSVEYGSEKSVNNLIAQLKASGDLSKDIEIREGSY